MHLFKVPLKTLKNHLIVPDGFWDTWEDERKKCNGCGTGWNKHLVPNTIYGLLIRIACCIHDKEYRIGGNEKDRKRADKNLHDNIDIIIDLYDKWYYPSGLAKIRADEYRFMVDVFGDNAFNYLDEVEMELRL